MVYSVIPGRAEGANPESRDDFVRYLDSGSPLRGVRNDGDNCCMWSR
jgi:hypothetical protein